MLEIKNGRIDRDGKPLFSQLSFMAKEGEVVCVAGSQGCGKSSLLQAMMGFIPLDEGWLNVDGDLVNVHSAPYFRRRMAYLPQNVNMPYDKVSDMISSLFSLKREKKFDEMKETLMTLWEEIGIAAEMFDNKLSEMITSEQRVILLSGLCVLEKELVLLDEPSLWLNEEQLTQAGTCIRQMARNDSSVVVTCQEHDPILRYCDKLVEINSNSYHN
ncbi:MAG: ABC transporter ATP-binding protein [Prevotella sp.]|nr:ABC transporter ATP-binding protein [Prevotella sp.]